ncbi:MAG: hypothetical protein UHE91_00640, partial [Bacteroidales bacterium]|nr:hypothetical protein [Bacteroidales bacterium]
MMDILIQWATLLSPIISVIAIIVALCIARSSSKDAQKQIDAIYNLLDVFVAVHNLDIFEAQRKYQQQLSDLDKQIEYAEIRVETAISPFSNGARIDNIQNRKEYLNQLLAKRKELE